MNLNKKISKYLMRLSGNQLFDIIPCSHNIRSFIYRKALSQQYNFSVHHHVLIQEHHKTPSDFEKINDKGLIIGRNCIFNDNVRIDLTGNVIIGDNVIFAEGALVYTHAHDGFRGTANRKVIPNTLTIEEGAAIGAGSIILSSCTNIGRYAQIGAGAVVRSSIPPYAIVAGNPAKIVGFVFSPSILEEFEEEKFSPEERISIDEYDKTFKRYYLERINNIKKFISL